MLSSTLHIFRLLIALGVMLSFATMGAARYADHSSTEPDAALAQFLLAGGSLEDICVDDTLGHAEDHSCEACRVGGALLFSGSADVFVPLKHSVAVVGLRAPDWLLPVRAPTGCKTPRAPPAV